MEIKITTDNFQKEVLESKELVLIDFFADWCGPCMMMGPIVERIAEKYKDKIVVGKCNIDEEMELAEKYKVMSIPTFIFFKNGEAVSTNIGSMSEKDLTAKTEEVLAM